jgi:allantoinase
VVFDADGEFVAEERHLHFRHRVSPYLGEKLRGVVKATYLRGAAVYEGGQFAAKPGGRECRQ